LGILISNILWANLLPIDHDRARIYHGANSWVPMKNSPGRDRLDKSRTHPRNQSDLIQIKGAYKFKPFHWATNDLLVRDGPKRSHFHDTTFAGLSWTAEQ
jgi:hypothetical protein